MSIRTIAIVGPTAVGKTELSLELASRLGGEVVNADSMQLYIGMDIGTAKLPVSQRRGVPHHMLDVLDVTQQASVAWYQRQGREVLADIHARGGIAVVVGGSGLFINALLDDLRFPGSDPQVRARLSEEARHFGAAALHQRLMRIDPAAAARILPTNERRIVRALEVVELTGAMPQTRLGPLRPVIPSVRVGLQRPRTELDQRIATRVEDMWHRGLVAEVARLADNGLRQGPTASRALGYRQVLDALAGDGDMERAKQDTVTATRRYVRRQQSWFARDAAVTWLDATASPVAQATALQAMLDSAYH